MTDVDICVCTFRRAFIAETLASIFRLAVPGDVRVSVIVVDNDSTPSARDLVDRCARDAPWTVHYLHRPAGNISIARNGALEASDARFLAFVDDDETVSRGWLAALLTEQRRSGAGLVLGPVRPVYADSAPAWMRRVAPHATRPVTRHGVISTGYTCNVLIDRGDVRIRDLRFAPELGRSGGEDTLFFGAAHARGVRIAYAPEARVDEPVPEARARLGWLATRRYRMGQTHVALLRTAPGFRAWQVFAAAGAKAVLCLAAAAAMLPSEVRRNTAFLRACLHIGALSALTGAGPVRLYGAPETRDLKASSAR